ncbi:Ubiquitin-conjugating enzyme E2 J1 [Lobulomyces angularis]|nr:Ubiquitin-conjugating enzyme E2 J1 [Lobulomyces angularis]
MSCTKRLLKEYAAIQADEQKHFIAHPLEDNILEWHFTIKGFDDFFILFNVEKLGPNEGGFTNGRYHGRMIFPQDYPFKPPNIVLLTPNGRFEVGKKICLSITGYHPEYWRPAWGVSSALVALIGFFPTKGEGAVGSLDYTKEERKVYAKESRSFKCQTCGQCNSDIQWDDDVEGVITDKDVKKKSNITDEISFKINSTENLTSSNTSQASHSASTTETTTLTNNQIKTESVATKSVNTSIRQRNIPTNNIPAENLQNLNIQTNEINNTDSLKRKIDILLMIILCLAGILIIKKFLVFTHLI